MAAPTIVQTATAYVIATNGTISVTLGSAPTVGNRLLVVIGTLNQYSIPEQSGWVSDAAASSLIDVTPANNPQIFVASRVVVSGDGTSWTFNLPSSAGTVNTFGAFLWLAEISGSASVFASIGIGTNTPVPAGPLYVVGPADVLLVGAAFAFDAAGSTAIAIDSASTPSTGWSAVTHVSNSSYHGELGIATQAITGASGRYQVIADYSPINSQNTGGVGVTIALAATTPTVMGVRQAATAYVADASPVTVTLLLAPIANNVLVGAIPSLFNGTITLPAGWTSVDHDIAPSGGGNYIQILTGMQTVPNNPPTTYSFTDSAPHPQVAVQAVIVEVFGATALGGHGVAAGSYNTPPPALPISAPTVVVSLAGFWSNGGAISYMDSTATPSYWPVFSQIQGNYGQVAAAWNIATASQAQGLIDNNSIQGNNVVNAAAQLALLVPVPIPTAVPRKTYWWGPGLHRAASPRAGAGSTTSLVPTTAPRRTYWWGPGLHRTASPRAGAGPTTSVSPIDHVTAPRRTYWWGPGLHRTPGPRTGAGATSITTQPITPETPGYQYTSRQRTGFATATVMAPIAPPPPGGQPPAPQPTPYTPPPPQTNPVELPALGIPRVSEVYPAPVLAGGIPYKDSSYDEWRPSSVTSQLWAKQLQILVNNQDVTFFRNVPTIVQSWSSQEPFGDAAAVVLFPSITSFDRLPAPQALPAGQVVGIARTYTGKGYWQASALGLVTQYGDASFFGDQLGLLNAPVSGIASHPSTYGYWLVAQDGGVFAFGGSPFAGSATNFPPSSPVVGIASSATGNGYWLVGQDGSVYAFGDATYHGNALGIINYPTDQAVGICRSTGGNGYLIASASGGVYAFGDANYHGNGLPYYVAPYSGIARWDGSSGDGYLLCNQLGDVYAFGAAQYFGGAGNLALTQPVNSMDTTVDGLGYWLSAGDGGVFSYGDAVFYGSVPAGGTVDYGSLSWLRFGAPITINYIDSNGTPHTLYEGVVASWEDAVSSGASAVGLTVQCVGALFQLDWYVAKPIFDLPFLGYNPNTGAPIFGWDVGTAIATAINSAITNPTPGTAIGPGWRPPESPSGSPVQIALAQPVTTGILTVQQPQWDKLLSGYVQNILAQAQTQGGSQWTVGLLRPRTPVIRRKGTSDPPATRNWTVSCGGRGVAHQLALDVTTAANAIYGQGTSPTVFLNAPAVDVAVETYSSTVLGLTGSWAGSRYPQVPPAASPFPLPKGHVFKPGGADTGFKPFSDQLRNSGYPLQSQDTYLATNVAAAVLDEVLITAFQQFAGLTVTGLVDVNTWNAAWSVGQNAGDINAVHYAPLAELPAVEPYYYSSTGATIGNNPAFLPHIPRIERFEQMGQQITKAQGILSAQVELERSQIPSWTGTVTLTADPEEGSRFQIIAGDNLTMRYFHGQTTQFHISAVSVDFTSLTVQLTVSTLPTDFMTLASIYARDSQAHGVARQARPNLVNLNVSSNTTVYDSESGAGRVPPTPLGGGWTVIRVPFAQSGSVAVTNLTTSPPTEFAVAVFSGPVTAQDLVNAGMATPNAVDAAGNNPWNDAAAALDTLGLLYSAGGPGAMAGYWPSDPAGTQVLSGRYVDGNTWPFAPAPGYSPWLWVAFWVATPCTVSGVFLVAPPQP